MPEFTVKGKKYHFPYTKEGIKKAMVVKKVATLGKKVGEMMRKKKKMGGQYYSKREGFGKM